MNSDELRLLASTFSSDLETARAAKQGQGLLAIATNLEDALATWKMIAGIMEASRTLKIDLGATLQQIELLKENPFETVKELILLPASDLAKRPANTFREYDKVASGAKQLLTERWKAWSTEVLAPLAVLDPILDRVPALAPLKPRIVGVQRERRIEPPSNDEEVKAVQGWLARCNELSAEANRTLDPGVGDFIDQATKGDGAWLDLVSPTTLQWMIDNDFARFLRIKLYAAANPNPAAKAPSDTPSPPSDDDDWT